ncbi:MAG: hypothetical protein AAFN30_17245, partial [Actinomycetota bacterium]
MAYVAYAWESSEGLVYVTQSDDDEVGKDLSEIARQSFDNLDADVGSHEIVEADGSRLLVAAGQDTAAERVLSERHMLNAHEALGADRIVASVAKRGQLLATAFDGSTQASRWRFTMVARAWAE